MSVALCNWSLPRDRADDRQRTRGGAGAVRYPRGDRSARRAWRQPADPPAERSQRAGPTARTQGRHPHHGRPGHPRGCADRVPAQPRASGRGLLRPDPDHHPRHPGHGRSGADRRPRKGSITPEPRRVLESQRIGVVPDGRRHRRDTRHHHRHRHTDLADSRRPAWLGLRAGRVGVLGGHDHLRDDQRGERHRRPRRSRRRLCPVRFHCVHRDRVLGAA